MHNADFLWTRNCCCSPVPQAANDNVYSALFGIIAYGYGPALALIHDNPASPQ